MSIFSILNLIFDNSTYSIKRPFNINFKGHKITSFTIALFDIFLGF